MNSSQKLKSHFLNNKVRYLNFKRLTKEIVHYLSNLQKNSVSALPINLLTPRVMTRETTTKISQPIEQNYHTLILNKRDQ